MLIDTGSAATLMNLQTWNRLKTPGSKLKKTDAALMSASGGDIVLYGKKDVIIKIGEKSVMHEMEIGNCQDGVILGLDFIRSHIQNLDIVSLTADIAGSREELTLFAGCTSRVRVISRDSITIPGRTEQMLTGVAGTLKIGEGLLEGEEKLPVGRTWMLARAVVTITNRCLPVRLVNLGDEELTLRSGTYLGSLLPISEETKIIPTVRRIQPAVEDADTWKNYQGLKTLRDAATAGLDADQTQAVE